MTRPEPPDPIDLETATLLICMVIIIGHQLYLWGMVVGYLGLIH